MRFFLLGVLMFSLTGIVSCGNQMTETDPDTTTTDGTGQTDKPTDSEKIEFNNARRKKVDVAHKQVQILNLSDKTVALRSTITVAGVDATMTLTPPSLAIDEVTTINRTINGADLEVVLYRILHDSSGVQYLGVEYRVSRSELNNTWTASQFLKLRLDRGVSSQVVTKQKFEFPSKSNIMQWVY